MGSTIRRTTLALWATLLEAALPGVGYFRNGFALRACWDAVGFLALVAVLFSFAGRSFALFAWLGLFIAGWRLTHILWAGMDGWKSPIGSFPWFRTLPVLVLASLVCGGVLVYSVEGAGLPLRYRLYRLPGGSMQPTVLPGDRFVVDSRWYQHQNLQRGDVVAVVNPQDDEMLLKRCVALPGDRVECRGSDVIVNGRVMTFFRASETVTTRSSGSDGAYMGPLTLAEGTFYCLGDDRADSLDSRILGPIPMGNLRGKALYLVTHGRRLVMGRSL